MKHYDYSRGLKAPYSIGDLVTKREGAVGLRSAIEYVLSIDVILFAFCHRGLLV